MNDSIPSAFMKARSQSTSRSVWSAWSLLPLSKRAALPKIPSDVLHDQDLSGLPGRRATNAGASSCAVYGRSIPTGLRPPAQGCEERATLGTEPSNEQTLKGFRHPRTDLKTYAGSKTASCTLRAFRKAEVAQISNLLCRRLLVGRCWTVQELAVWKSAISSSHSKRFAKSFAIRTFLTFHLAYFLAAGPASAATLLLTGATIHTISGETFTPGQVLIRDGKIAAVGK